ncbi:MAG: AI-2E family transporter [Bacteroidota bacterium]
MDKIYVNLPIYSKLAQILIGLVAFFYILFIGQSIIVPLVFAMLMAILLNPVVNWLSGKKLNRALAITLVLLAAFVITAALAYFIGSKVAGFSESFPVFRDKFFALANDAIGWVSQTFNVDKAKIDEWISKTQGEGMNSGTAIVGQTLLTLGDVLVLFFLLPVYVFMILFYKPLLLNFISQLFHQERHVVVADVLAQTKVLIQSYLVGLMLEVAIVATLNSIGLLIIGIRYAIVLGIIGAVLNTIPYIGGVVAIALSILVALATGTTADALWVLVVYVLVQLIDNNFIVPKIVASRVKINALVSIIVVLIGGALWGVPGMFLSIPLTAIIKVIFDRVDSLKAWGFLLGDDMPAFTSFLKLPPIKRGRKKQQ